MKIILLLRAFFVLFALCNICQLSPAGIVSAVLAGFTLLFTAYTEQKVRAATLPKGFSPVCSLLGALYMLFYMASEHKILAGNFDSSLFRLAFLLGTAVGLFFLFRDCCRVLMLLFASAREKWMSKTNPTAAPVQNGCPSRPAKWLVFGGLLLCWLPWFLYNYPGVMTPDSISQFSQATGLIPYSSHHPVLHTLLFGCFYKLGFALTHSVNAGIACYILFQMCTLAAVETCCIGLLQKRGLPRWMLAVWFCFWGLVPYNGIFAVTVWKDILFSAFVLLYVLILYQLLEKTDLCLKKDWRLLLLLFVSGWLTCMLRSNGLYVFLFTLPFVLIVFRKQLKFLLPVQLGILLLALVLQGPVMDACNVSKPHLTESLSIPLQQVARVVAEGRSLTPEQEALIDQVADHSFIPDYYDPILSDPIKALVTYNNADYLAAHKGEFFRLWVKLGLTYPGDYLEAFIDQTRGYWYPAPATLRTNEGISPNEIGLAWPHLLRGQLPVKISEILLKLPDLVPVYGLLWSIGAFTWAMLFLFAFQFLYGGKKMLVLYLPFIGTILTLLLATPVASDIRYAYAIILGMPFMLSVPMISPVPAVVIPDKKG